MFIINAVKFGISCYFVWCLSVLFLPLLLTGGRIWM